MSVSIHRFPPSCDPPLFISLSGFHLLSVCFGSRLRRGLAHITFSLPSSSKLLSDSLSSYLLLSLGSIHPSILPSRPGRHNEITGNLIVLLPAAGGGRSHSWSQGNRSWLARDQHLHSSCCFSPLLPLRAQTRPSSPYRHLPERAS